MSMSNHLFRYDDRVYSVVDVSPSGIERICNSPVRIELSTFKVLKETPCGFWIDYAFSKKWVSKIAKKRFAWEREEEAILSLLARKNRQQSIYRLKLGKAMDAIGLAEDELRRIRVRNSNMAKLEKLEGDKNL